MKKPLIAAGLLLLGLAGYAVAGRVNMVWHVDKRTNQGEWLLLSGGACRHHLSAHADDLLSTADPEVPTKNPDDCN